MELLQVAFEAEDNVTGEWGEQKGRIRTGVYDSPPAPARL
jgi:hypothetical protein